MEDSTATAGGTCATGAPGIAARWTSSAKSGVGTALSAASPLWFTLSHGIVNEVYHPRLDAACTRDFGLLLIGPDGSFQEEKRDAHHHVAMLGRGIPAFHLRNEARNGAWRIDKLLCSDPARPCLLQEIALAVPRGQAGSWRLHALLAPHLVNAGMGNSAWVGEYHGVPLLFAAGRAEARVAGGGCLALASSVPWGARSAGYVGFSDGWQQLRRDGRLDPACACAGDGNVALAGEILLPAPDAKAVLALAFGATPEEAAAHALASLEAGFDEALAGYHANWRAWQDGLMPLDRPAGVGNGPGGDADAAADGKGASDPYRVSTAVLASHRSLAPEGAAVASLSIPWGFARGDDDLGGYHLVWPRDLVETAGGFLAAGDPGAARAILGYLRAIQHPDGHWPQNAWLDGRPYWQGIQMDECAFPILLADTLRRAGELPDEARESFMPMIEAAAGYVLRNGPVTAQDRWEEDAGYSPFTLAAEIVALLAAADMIALSGKPAAAALLRETADCWNDQIERWTYAAGGPLAAEFGVAGHYIRIAPPDSGNAASPKDGYVPIKNRPPGDSSLPARQVVSPDALALVRFGLRAPDDPRILDTLKVIDGLLACDLPQGRLWYRYNDDGYGEHDDGAPFDGTGTGRPWPLLAGERAHYELAAGNLAGARRLLAALEGSAGDGGLIPEQVWDGPDRPARGLRRGRPSGSAMPLVWAHAEHVKLLRSLTEGRVFDMPPQGVARYIRGGTTAGFRSWRFNHRIASLPAGKALRLELPAPAMVHWSTDGWASVHDRDTDAAGFGLHLADLPVGDRPPGTTILFTFLWRDSDRWENVDHAVAVEADDRLQCTAMPAAC